MNSRLSRLEAHARSSHSAAWGSFWTRFHAALDSVPPEVFEESFGPVDLDALGDLRDALLPWDEWSVRIVPLLEKEESGDLSAWPDDLPTPPSDPRPLLLALVARWRKNPELRLGTLFFLLALAVAVEGEGGVAPSRR